MKASFPFLVFLLLLASVKSQATDIITRGTAAEYIAEFIDIGNESAKMIGKLSSFPVTEAQMLDAVKTTKIEFTEDKLISPQGIEVDALNYPAKKLIRVNWNRWFRYRWSEDNRSQLAIHEYLGILKVDDSKYYWSHYLMKGGKLVSVTTCDYEIDGQPQYIKMNNYSGLAYITDRGFDLSYGEGTTASPITTHPLAISSLNFKWSDIWKGNLEGITKWGIGMTWKYKNHSLHAFITLQNAIEAKKFNLEVFEMNNFDRNGVLTPRHFMTVPCEPKKISEE